MTYSIAMNFADAVVPVIAGNQLVLPQPPNPPESRQLFRNGSLQHNGPDYVGNANLLIPSPPADPATPGFAFTAIESYVAPTDQRKMAQGPRWLTQSS